MGSSRHSSGLQLTSLGLDLGSSNSSDEEMGSNSVGSPSISASPSGSRRVHFAVTNGDSDPEAVEEIPTAPLINTGDAVLSTEDLENHLVREVFKNCVSLFVEIYASVKNPLLLVAAFLTAIPMAINACMFIPYILKLTSTDVISAWEEMGEMGQWSWAVRMAFTAVGAAALEVNMGLNWYFFNNVPPRIVDVYRNARKDPKSIFFASFAGVLGVAGAIPMATVAYESVSNSRLKSLAIPFAVLNVGPFSTSRFLGTIDFIKYLFNLNNIFKQGQAIDLLRHIEPSQLAKIQQELTDLINTEVGKGKRALMYIKAPLEELQLTSPTPKRAKQIKSLQNKIDHYSLNDTQLEQIFMDFLHTINRKYAHAIQSSTFPEKLQKLLGLSFDISFALSIGAAAFLIFGQKGVVGSDLIAKALLGGSISNNPYAKYALATTMAASSTALYGKASLTLREAMMVSLRKMPWYLIPPFTVETACVVASAAGMWFVGGNALTKSIWPLPATPWDEEMLAALMGIGGFAVNEWATLARATSKKRLPEKPEQITVRDIANHFEPCARKLSPEAAAALVRDGLFKVKTTSVRDRELDDQFALPLYTR